MHPRQPGVPAYDTEEFAPRRHEYCVLIPIINEGERIARELERARKAGVPEAADIVICDGGSTDGCTDHGTLRALGVNTLLTKHDTGRQGAQLRMGFSWALDRGYRGFITIDGNDKDSIEDVPRFIKKLREGYDFVQGSRFVPGGVARNTPLSRYIAVRLIHAPVISLTAESGTPTPPMPTARIRDDTSSTRSAARCATSSTATNCSPSSRHAPTSTACARARYP